LNLDHLTHVANRRALDQFLEQLQRQEEVVDAPISVLMMDLDHFKVVNDTWGHEIGDEVLKNLTRRWSAQLRSSDMLARLGGEEFTAVLVRTQAKNATVVAEKIRVATEREPVVVVRDGEVLTVPITVSIGIATVKQWKGVDIKQLYRAADEALYEAKHSGRNCIRQRIL
jgi:diguanylate cyclase (GGDEF)-like protein